LPHKPQDPCAQEGVDPIAPLKYTNSFENEFAIKKLIIKNRSNIFFIIFIIFIKFLEQKINL
jgi:hypothetical protein